MAPVASLEGNWLVVSVDVASSSCRNGSLLRSRQLGRNASRTRNRANVVEQRSLHLRTNTFCMRLALACDKDQPEEIPPSGESTSGKTGSSCHLAVDLVTKRKLPDMANEIGGFPAFFAPWLMTCSSRAFTDLNRLSELIYYFFAMIRSMAGRQRRGLVTRDVIT